MAPKTSKAATLVNMSDNRPLIHKHLVGTTRSNLMETDEYPRIVIQVDRVTYHPHQDIQMEETLQENGVLLMNAKMDIDGQPI